jgi:hypothetical protein
MPTGQRRKHPTLEGIRHSLDWIWMRIEPIEFCDEDRETLLKWLRELSDKVAKRG